MPSIKRRKFFLSVLLLLTATHTSANGVLRNGIGSRSMGLGGADLVFSGNPLGAMNSNPAALSRWNNRELQFSLATAILDAEYSNSVSNGNEADTATGIIPDVAYIHSLTDRLTLGAAINPVSALEADWEFPDPPGATGSYGVRTHRSSYVALRAALGAGVEVTPEFSLGASVGLVYNRNRLEAPYIFQTATGLAGAKVLANLEADGFGWNGVFSGIYRPADNLEFSVAYTTRTTFNTEGTLRGTTDPVIGVGGFAYDAEVKTALPQRVSAGFGWQASGPLRLGVQVDWIDWSEAFDRLPLRLTNGTNGALPATLSDIAPLDWEDRFVYRFGAEYEWSDKLQLRAGYSFGESPAPSETLTPTSAVIMKHTLGFGAGYRLGNYTIDLAYQWDLPAADRVGTSRLLAGEYNGSRTEVSIHWLSVSVSLTDPW
jgi:long-subunit fatty acid transport protein